MFYSFRKNEENVHKQELFSHRRRSLRFGIINGVLCSCLPSSPPTLPFFVESPPVLRRLPRFENEEAGTELPLSMPSSSYIRFGSCSFTPSELSSSSFLFYCPPQTATPFSIVLRTSFDFCNVVSLLFFDVCLLFVDVISFRVSREWSYILRGTVK